MKLINSILLILISLSALSQTPFDTLFQDKGKIGLRDSNYLAKNYFNNKQIPGWLAQSFFKYGVFKEWSPSLYNFKNANCSIMVDLLRDGYKIIDKNGILYQYTIIPITGTAVISSISIHPFKIPNNVLCGAYNEKGEFFYPYDQYEGKPISPKASYKGNDLTILVNDAKIVTIFAFIKSKDISGLNTFLIQKMAVKQYLYR